MILNDVCELIVDCLHSTAYDEGCGYPLIRTPNIGRGRLILDDVHRVSEKVYIERNVRATPQEDDLVLAREAPAGNIAIIGENQKVCLGQRTVLIRPDIKKVSSLYLMYYLLMTNQQYELLGTANGATVPHVNMSTIRKLPIALPDLETQKRVAESINVYDNLIENNQKQIKLLEEAAPRLYKEGFIDLRFPGHENVEIVDEVPEGWNIGILSDIGIFKRGKTITKAKIVEGEVPVISGGLGPAYYHNESNTSSPVITVSGSGANAGFTRLYYTKVFASDCSFVDTEQTPYLYWIYLFLKNNSSRLDMLQKGSAQPHVYAKDINALECVIPIKEVLNLFCEVVGSYFNKIGILEQQIIRLTEARDRLLPKLMSGEIEV